MRPIVAIDCDGVLSDWHALAMPIMNNLLNSNFTTKDITNWDIYHLIDDQSIKDSFHDLLNNSGMIEHLPVYEGSQKAIDEIRKLAEVYIVTSPMNEYHDWIIHRNKWLKKNFDILPKNIIHTSAKYLIQANIFIDDKPENVEKWYQNNSGIPILWKHECVQNNPFEYSQRIIHTNDWNDVLEILRNWFESHLNNTSNTVKSWPSWKQNVLGKIS